MSACNFYVKAAFDFTRFLSETRVILAPVLREESLVFRPEVKKAVCDKFGDIAKFVTKDKKGPGNYLGMITLGGAALAGVAYGCSVIYDQVVNSGASQEAKRKLDASETDQRKHLKDCEEAEKLQVSTFQSLINVLNQQAEQTVPVQKSAGQQESSIITLEEKSKQVCEAKTLLERCQGILKETIDQLGKLPVHKERVEKIQERTAMIKALEGQIDELEKRITTLTQDLEEETRLSELVLAAIDELE